MVTKVKVSDFVSSTARYAKKAGLAADKNQDGKLSKAEAKSLPKDLRDDYARQSKLKASITPSGFASDQAAYVAANAKKADKNKDGVLTATEAKGLPASIQDNYKNYAASLGSAPAVSPDAFVGTGAGKKVTLDGKSFTQLPASAAVNALVQKLVTDADQGSAYATAFKGKPADLAAALANPQANKQFFNDLLFRATGTTYDKDYPNYYTPAGLTVTPVTAGQALSKLTADFSDNSTPTSDQVPGDCQALMNAMKEPGSKLFKLNWNNSDDAWFNATVAINPTTGQIRAVGNFGEP